MPRLTLAGQVVTDLSRSLGEGNPAEQVSRTRLSRKRLVPPRFEWDPDLCLLSGRNAYLVFATINPEIPEWVREPCRRLRGRYGTTKLVILVRSQPDQPVWKVARDLTQECVDMGRGLAIEISDGACLVLPPDCPKPVAHRSKLEGGHIPRWVVERLVRSRSFSAHLSRCLQRFAEKYGRATGRRAPSYDDESDLLMDFARRVKRGDPRLYVPLGRLNALGETERLREQSTSRDHFFHTFNNLFLGFLILGELFVDRDPDIPPDKYVRDKGCTSKLKPWESLWFLTCLFHDPGYLAEKIWLTVAYAYGFPNQLSSGEKPPDPIVEQLKNAWDTHHKDAAEELVDLFRRLKRERDWEPLRFSRAEATAFDKALRQVYFDGTRVGHSLQSGLYLINSCTTERTPQSGRFDQEVALAACEIAALSMMFHDQHCRAVMKRFDVGPLAFEVLPYAAVMMFVDALQDDRRDITKNRFPDHGVLEDVEVYRENGRKVVRARVCLCELPLEWWPGKIEEYEGVTRWINVKSETKFLIDYESRAWGR